MTATQAQFLRGMLVVALQDAGIAIEMGERTAYLYRLCFQDGTLN